MKKEEIIAFCELVKNDIANNMVISKTNERASSLQDFHVCDKGERESLDSEHGISISGTIYESGHVFISVFISPNPGERESFVNSYKKLEELNKQALKEKAIEKVLGLRRKMYEEAERLAANSDMTVEEIVNLPF